MLLKVGQKILLLFIIQEHFDHGQKVNFEDLTLQEIKNCLDFLINKNFFQVGSKILRLVIGIPMGSDPAPFNVDEVKHQRCEFSECNSTSSKIFFCNN